MKLRPYQTDIQAAIFHEWNRGARNVLAVLPTGSGKTVVVADIIRQERGPAVAIAHRQELVGQMSVALARVGVVHRIIGPEAVVRFIVRAHVETFGRSFYEPAAPVAVASVDTLIRRPDRWLDRVGLWVMDEGHHIVAGNKWGTAAAMMPNARGLAVTATPLRADGAGLGRHADGLADVLVEGPGMADLIAAGWLSPYRVFCPASDIDLTAVPIGSTGDFSGPKLREAVRKSRVVGDVVREYKRHADGKLGITFATDVEFSAEIAASYNAAGVPAEVVSHKTSDADRASILRRFRNRDLLQLVNVDLFGEGFDLPAVEVVSMVRPTESFGLFSQQFGRAMRPMEGKKAAIIIDHVGNVERHLLPDAPRVWTLDRRERRGRSTPSDAVPLRACPGCSQPFERIHRACPWCGFYPEPEGRARPEQVDGDLLELDAAALARLRRAVDDVDLEAGEYREQLIRKRVPMIGQLALVKRHAGRRRAQEVLRACMGFYLGQGDPVEAQRRFFHRFGVDVLTAKALNTKQAGELAERISHAFV